MRAHVPERAGVCALRASALRRTSDKGTRLTSLSDFAILPHLALTCGSLKLGCALRGSRREPMRHGCSFIRHPITIFPDASRSLTRHGAFTL